MKTSKGPLFEQKTCREAKCRPSGAVVFRRRDKVDQTRTHAHENSKLEMPINLKASGCRHCDTLQKFLAYRDVATLNC
jgi:hypothetical protein